MKFKARDRVKYIGQTGITAHGEITLINENFPKTPYKVLFDGDCELDYTYYSEKELELDNEPTNLSQKV